MSFSGNNNLTTVSIPNSVISIGGSAFYECNLTTVSIPNSVASIGAAVFFGNNNLTAINVVIDNPIYSSEDGILFNKTKTTLITYPQGKQATTYTIPNSVNIIERCAFSNCSNLSDITLPDSGTFIGDNAFFNCSNLISIAIPNGVTSIGELAFYACRSLTSIILPNSVTSIGKQAFYACTGLTSVNIPNSVISIDVMAFGSCQSLREVNIPDSVTTIHWETFSGCRRLESITIGSSVTSIEPSAFFQCYNLQKITTKNENPPLAYNTTFTCPDYYNLIVYVPCGSVSAYQAATGWDIIRHIIEKNYENDYAIKVLSNNTDIGTVAQLQSPSCETDTLVIQATAHAPHIFTQWSDGNTDNPRTVIVTQDTSFTAIFTARCSITATINDPTMGHITGDGIYIVDSMATLTATPNPGYLFKNWTSNGGVISNLNPFTFTVAGDTVIMAHFEKDDTGVEDVESLLANISLYPNPVQSTITISTAETIRNIELYNLSGQLLGTYNQITISVSHLPAGVYFVKITTDSGSVTKKVVKN
ncbi:leucine-rich repeat protein [Bacteroidales bacterium OttesenSCG-928-C03]|nr:leucine-rich repeat protein [Bacteroidales bacterium OttesenSCG-928-C03]